MDIWILAGQSNMQGVGLLADPRRAIHTDDRVEHFTMAGEWAPGADPLHRLWESYTPVHSLLHRVGLLGDDRNLTDSELAARERTDARDGAGLGMAFATRMADLTGERIGLIPAAHGGTTLEQWEPGFGGEPASSRNTLYGSLLDRVDRAKKRKQGTLRGILWYQGESDATPRGAADYAERFDSWLSQLRDDLGDALLPFYAVQLGRFASKEDPGYATASAWDRIREAQRTLPARAASTGLVSAVDLGLSDAIHISAPELERLGFRLAELAHGGGTGPDVASVDATEPAINGLCVVTVRCSGVRGGWQGTTHRGFQLCDEGGVPIPRLSVVDAHPDPLDRRSIRIVTNVTDALALAGTFLSYGLGYDPVCTVVDDHDLPLPSFAPQEIGMRA